MLLTCQGDGYDAFGWLCLIGAVCDDVIDGVESCVVECCVLNRCWCVRRVMLDVMCDNMTFSKVERRLDEKSAIGL